VAKPAGDGIATLEVVSRGRTLTRVKGHYEVIIGSDESGEPIKQLRELTEPMRRWTIERKSFEDNRLDAPRNRGGRPDKYPHMRIVIEAMIYIAVNGPPATLDGEGGLFEKLGLRLKPAETPGPGTLYNIFNPIWKRIEDERKDIEDARKKFKNKKKSDQ
jgi:hypothetical protein